MPDRPRIATRPTRGGPWRGLTTRGRCLLAGGLAAGACAFILDERDLLRVGIFAAVLPVIAMLAGMGRRVRLSAAHQVSPARIDPGTEGRVSLVLVNNGLVRSSTVEIAEPPTPDLTGGVRCLLPPLRPGQRGQTDYPLRPARRGRFLLGPPTVRLGDPFGLWEETRVLPAQTEVLVVPAVAHLVGMPVSTGSRSAAADRATAGATGGDPDVGVRQYRSGDDIRTIHWRASARHDELMVRLDEPVSHGEATVMLDHRRLAHRGRGAGSSVETAVSLAASICLHLLGADHQIRLTTHDGSALARGRDITDDVLARLAVIEPDADRTLSGASIAGSGLIIAVLGDLDATDARTLIAARRRNTNGVAFVLRTREWSADPDRPIERADLPGKAASLLRTAGWRVVDVHRHDDLAVAWGRACAGSPAFERTWEAEPALAGARRRS